jgi:hypothetical protein
MLPRRFWIESTTKMITFTFNRPNNTQTMNRNSIFANVLGHATKSTQSLFQYKYFCQCIIDGLFTRDVPDIHSARNPRFPSARARIHSSIRYIPSQRVRTSSPEELGISWRRPVYLTTRGVRFGRLMRLLGKHGGTSRSIDVIVYNLARSEDASGQSGFLGDLRAIGNGISLRGWRMSMVQKQWKRISVAVIANTAAALFCLVFLAVPGYGQNLTGRWTIVGQTLDNGEQLRSIVELKQSGNELTGEMKNLGYRVGLKGTATGSHFELFATWNATKPFLVGDLVNGELHAVQRGRRNVVAMPTTAGDDSIPRLHRFRSLRK